MQKQLSIFDALEELEEVTSDQPLPEEKPKLILLRVNHGDRVIGPSETIEKIRSYYYECPQSFFKIKAEFFKVNDIDFYNTLVFEFPKSKIKCEYTLLSEMNKKHRFSTLYLCKKDLKEYLDMRFTHFLGMSNSSFSANEKFAIRMFLPPTNSFYENLKSNNEDI